MDISQCSVGLQDASRSSKSNQIRRFIWNVLQTTSQTATASAKITSLICGSVIMDLRIDGTLGVYTDSNSTLHGCYRNTNYKNV